MSLLSSHLGNAMEASNVQQMLISSNLSTSGYRYLAMICCAGYKPKQNRFLNVSGDLEKMCCLSSTHVLHTHQSPNKVLGISVSVTFDY
jgi:hypothetical protein